MTLAVSRLRLGGRFYWKNARVLREHAASGKLQLQQTTLTTEYNYVLMHSVRNTLKFLLQYTHVTQSSAPSLPAL